MDNLPPGWKKFGTLTSKRADGGMYWQVTWDLVKEGPMKPVKRKLVTLKGLDLDLAVLAEDVNVARLNSNNAIANLVVRVNALEALVRNLDDRTRGQSADIAGLMSDMISKPKPCWWCRLLGRK